MPHRVWDFPVMQGTIRNAKGRYVARNLTFPAPYGHVMAGPAYTPERQSNQSAAKSA